MAAVEVAVLPAPAPGALLPVPLALVEPLVPEPLLIDPDELPVPAPLVEEPDAAPVPFEPGMALFNRG